MERQMQPDPVFAAPGRFLKGNIHTHSTLSDGKRTPEDVVETYRRGGYDFMARYNFPIADTRRFRAPGFTTLLGAEVHAPATSLGEIWHILAVGLPLDFAPIPAGSEADPGRGSWVQSMKVPSSCLPRPPCGRRKVVIIQLPNRPGAAVSSVWAIGLSPQGL